MLAFKHCNAVSHSWPLISFCVKVAQQQAAGNSLFCTYGKPPDTYSQTRNRLACLLPAMCQDCSRADQLLVSGKSFCCKELTETKLIYIHCTLQCRPGPLSLTPLTSGTHQEQQQSNSNQQPEMTSHSRRQSVCCYSHSALVTYMYTYIHTSVQCSYTALCRHAHCLQMAM